MHRLLLTNDVSLKSCQGIIQFEEVVLGSIMDDWSIRFCKIFLKTLLNATVHPNNKYSRVKGCGVDIIRSDFISVVTCDVNTESSSAPSTPFDPAPAPTKPAHTHSSAFVVLGSFTSLVMVAVILNDTKL